MKLMSYATAFAFGYVGALIPILATGQFPDQKALIAAIAAGLVATGLFHLPSPKQKE